MAMIENAAQLIDPGALAIVLAGTGIATFARCGWSDLRAAAVEAARLGRSGFDEAANRRALSRTIREIQRVGLLGADAPLPPDRSLAVAVAALLKSGSLDAFHTARRADRAAREAARAAAIRVFEYAGELGPVFGLVGTLFAITQFVPGAGSAAAAQDPTITTLAAVGTAVLSSLYGVLTAHLVCIPIAHAIERKGEREEDARSRLAGWVDDEITAATGRCATVTRLREVIPGDPTLDKDAAARRAR